MGDMSDLPSYAHLLAWIEQIPIIDTHEHIGDRGLGAEEDTVFCLGQLLCTPYLSNRLVSAGVPASVFARRDDDPQTFRRTIVDNLDLVRATCQYQNFARALDDLHQFPEQELTLATWEDLDKRVVQAYSRGYRAWCAQAFQSAHIQVALKNTHLPYYTRFLPGLDADRRAQERKLFHSLPAFDWVLFGYERENERTRVLKPTQAAMDSDPANFDEYLDMVWRFVLLAKRHGAVGLKCTAAYFRMLDFQISTREEAHRTYDAKPGQITAAQAKAFQDYLMQQVILAAAEHNLPIHIHTGAIFGTSMELAGLAPSKLCTILSWPEAAAATIVLLHGGFPYTGEMSTIAKTFPNVCLDYSDVGMVSLETLRRCLHEWIECVPSNKIMQGGDALNIEQCYGVTVRQREALAQVLAEKTESGQITLPLAKSIARRILHDNAKEIFHLEAHPDDQLPA